MNCFEIPFSRKRIRKAGDYLRSCDWSDKNAALQELDILSVWRSAHAWHLSNFNSFIRRKLSLADVKYKNIIIGQRLKRLPSIIGKLERFPDMALDRMQDIAGFRVIFDSKSDVYAFQQEIEKNHGKREKGRVNDYIAHPKKDGYRSIHTVFRCFSKSCPQFDGLCVELQLRTRLQHTWSTAVETLGILTHSSIKTGQGSEDHETYFKIISALFSIEENSPIIEEFSLLSKSDLIKKLREIENKTHATNILESAAKSAVKIISQSDSEAAYHVIELNVRGHTVSMTAFSKEQLRVAESFYKTREKETKDDANISIVLISVGSVKEVKKAYPNFFLDTNSFIKKVRGYLSE